MSTNAFSRSRLAVISGRRLEKIRKIRRTEAVVLQKTPEDFAHYRTDPLGYVREVLGVKLWPKQEEILLSLTTEPQIAIRSGQKCGKSRVAACAALWFWSCFPAAFVILTAPTGRQVREILWKEIALLYNNSRVQLGGRLASAPSSGLRAADGRAIIGFSTTATKAENMAGPSGAALMYIVDEASGYSQTIFDAIQGNLSGSVVGRLVILSNPTRPTGFFYDAFHRSAASWKKFRISSEEAAQYADVFPGLMRPETIVKKTKDPGRDSAWFRIRILGEFPDKAANAIVSLKDVDAAKDAFLTEALKRLRAKYGPDVPESRAAQLTLQDCAELFTMADGPLELGVDVARFGDDRSVIQPRRGRFLFPYVAVHGYDSGQVAGEAIRIAKILRAPHEIAFAKVDVIGYGAGVFDFLNLEENRAFVRPVAVNVSVVSDDPEKFPNLRSQLWFAIADFLRESGALHVALGEEEGRLEAELLTPGYKVDPRGRQVVEEKLDIKARLGRSPDIADAVGLAIYNARPLPPAQVPKTQRDSARDGGSRWSNQRGFSSRVPHHDDGLLSARRRKGRVASRWSRAHREGCHAEGARWSRDPGPGSLVPVSARGWLAHPDGHLEHPS